MAMSIDGKTTFAEDDVSWVSQKDIKRFDALMVECGVMIMGSNTYRSFGEDLPNDKALQVVLTNNERLLNQKKDNVLFTNLPLEKVLLKLETDGFTKALIAGGSILNTSLLRLNLINEIRIIVKPVILGTGKPLCNALEDVQHLNFVSAEELSYGAVELRFVKND